MKREDNRIDMMKRLRAISFPFLVHPQVHLFTHFPHQMPVNVLISPYPRRIIPIHDTNKIIKFGIRFPKFGRRERVRFCPVRSSIMPNGDRFESIEVLAVWDRISVWPVETISTV